MIPKEIRTFDVLGSLRIDRFDVCPSYVKNVSVGGQSIQSFRDKIVRLCRRHPESRTRKAGPPILLKCALLTHNIFTNKHNHHV